MAFPIAAVAAAGASLVSSGLDFFGAREQRSHESQLTDRQLAFQERMSSTAYQRAMRDMRLAGLNPILAYKQGGASTPLGTVIPPSNVLGEIDPGGVVSSAIQADRTIEETRQVREVQKNVRQDTEKKAAEKRAAVQLERKYRLEGDILRNDWNKSAASAYEAIMTKELLRDPEFQKLWRTGRMTDALFGRSGATATGLRSVIQGLQRGPSQRGPVAIPPYLRRK